MHEFHLSPLRRDVQSDPGPAGCRCAPTHERWLHYLWPSAYSALGLALAWVVVACGGWWRVRAGALECGGGRLGAMAARLPRRCAFSAITLGHVILGLDGPTLDAVRRHEHVHVRQYERWGLLFGPAYLASSLLQWLRGRRPYLDNHFERQAYGEAGRSGGPPRK